MRDSKGIEAHCVCVVDEDICHGSLRVPVLADVTSESAAGLYSALL